MFLRNISLILTLVATLASGQVAYAEPNEDRAPTLEDLVQIDQPDTSFEETSQPDRSLSSYMYSKRVVENREVIMSWPVPNHKISSKFGWRNPSCNACSSNHKGIDFEADKGTEVKAVMQGIVTKIEYNGGYGQYVFIEHIAVIDDVEYHFESVYAHLINKSPYDYINVGDVVESGEVIGLSGRTGVATGPHLHFELRLDGEPINPMKYLLIYAY